MHLLAKYMVAIVLFLAPLVAQAQHACQNPNPNEVAYLSETQKEMTTLFVNAGEQAFMNRQFKKPTRVNTKVVDCTSTGKLAETLLLHKGVSLGDMSNLIPGASELSKDNYLVRISQDVLDMDQSIIVHIATHEACHIIMGTIPISGDENIIEEWTERCVTDVLGVEQHAVSLANLSLLYSVSDDFGAIFEEALKVVEERLVRIKNPYAYVPR